MSPKISLKLLILILQLTVSFIAASNFEQQFRNEVVGPYNRGVNFYASLTKYLAIQVASENPDTGISCLKPISSEIIESANQFHQEINSALQGTERLVNNIAHDIVKQTAEISQQETEIRNTVHEINNLQIELSRTASDINNQQQAINQAQASVNTHAGLLQDAENRLRKARQCLGIGYSQNYFFKKIGKLVEKGVKELGRGLQKVVCESVNLITNNINSERNNLNGARDRLSNAQHLLNQYHQKQAQLRGHIQSLESRKVNAAAREQSLRHNLNIARQQQGELIAVSGNMRKCATFLASVGINADALTKVIDFEFLFDANHVLFPLQEIERICKTHGVQVSLPMTEITATSQLLKNLAALVKTRPLMMPCD